MSRLREQVASGVRWSAGAHAGRHALQLGVTYVLVCLLTPADFGLIGMAMFFVGFVTLFHDLGTASALVQQPDLDQETRSSVFWVTLAVAVLAAIALAFAAPFVAAFYDEPRVEPILRALTASLVLAGLASVPRALLRRDLAFERLARVDLIAVISGGAAGIAGAASGHGAWSLVEQTLVTSAAGTVGVWARCAWRPSLRCSVRSLREVIGFGLSLTGYTVCNYVARNVDALILGKLLGPAALGHYVLAQRLMLYPLRNISAVVERVMFPAYARMQHDSVRFRRVYLRVTTALATVTFPAMVGIGVLAVPLVAALFGPEWAPAATLIMILAPIGLSQSVGTTVGNIYLARGRPGLLFVWGLIAAPLTTIALLIGAQWGAVGAAAGYVVVSLILLYPSFAIPLRLIELPVHALATALRVPLLLATVMGVALVTVDLALPPALPAAARLAILIPTGIGVYTLLAWSWHRASLRELIGLAMARTG